jgi:hypothetical protein
MQSSESAFSRVGFIITVALLDVFEKSPRMFSTSFSTNKRVISGSFCVIGIANRMALPFDLSRSAFAALSCAYDKDFTVDAYDDITRSSAVC